MSKARIKADPGTERDKRTKTALKGQDEKLVYIEVKRRALRYEQENYTELVAIRTQNPKWWKLVGHSAIMYKYMVAPRLRLKPKLLPDTDYNEKSKEGVVSISDINKFEEKLRLAKIFLTKETNWAKIFSLGERVSREDYLLMVDEDELRTEMANKLILPEVRLAELNAKVKAVINVIHPNVRKMDGAAREAFGSEMERKAVDLQLMVLRAARGTMDFEECLTRGFDIAEDLYGYTLVFLNLQLVEPKVVYRMAEAVTALETQIKKELKKLAMIKAEADLKQEVKKQTKQKKGKSDGDNSGTKTKSADGVASGTSRAKTKKSK